MTMHYLIKKLRSIKKIYFKAMNYKKIQFVGNSDEPLRTGKITPPNITIQMQSYQSDFDKYDTDNLLDFKNE